MSTRALADLRGICTDRSKTTVFERASSGRSAQEAEFAKFNLFHEHGPSNPEKTRWLPQDDAGWRPDPPKSASSHGSRGHQEHPTLDSQAGSADVDFICKATWEMSV